MLYALTECPPEIALNTDNALFTSPFPMYFYFILQNPKGRFYLSHSQNLTQRLESHN